MRIWREPLLHFAAAGAVVFAAFVLFGDDGGPPPADTIVVDRRGLLTFLQYRANAFEPDTFGAALDAMSDAELDQVIDAYITEEILYREATALGLEQSDNIIRQRLVQKMNFLLADLALQQPPPDRAALETYFRANIDAYAIDPWATFAHVFFDASERGDAGALAAAQAAAARLNDGPVPFDAAPQHGDDFPYLRNYVERTLDYVAGHFGPEFAARLEALAPDEQVWQGPIPSAFGHHLVLLTERTERTYPPLDDVAESVARDLAEQRAARDSARLTRELEDRYAIVIEPIRRTPSAPDARR